MLPFRRPLAALCACGLMAGVVPAEEFTLPAIGGEIAGDFTPLKPAGAPTLHWQLSLRSGRADERAADLRVDGPGTRVRGQVWLDPAGMVNWRLVEARIELASWSAALAAGLGPEFASLSTGGTVEASGEGTWRDGQLGGRAQLSLRDGRIDDPASKAALEGIVADVVFDDLAARRTAPAQTLTWSAGHFDAMVIGAGRVVFSLAGDQVRVSEALVAILGGQATLDAFAMSIARPEFAVQARVAGIEVAQLVPFLPAVLSEARGRLDGAVILKRDAAGIQVGAGRLALRGGETAELRLAPTPGLLSSSLPANVLKFYPGLGKIETGEVPLKADRLSVTFTPDGDAAGLTASVHLAGGPVDPKLTAPVDLVVNVRGPLDSLVRFGTNSRLRFGGAP